jgi:hypothetical protein
LKRKPSIGFDFADQFPLYLEMKERPSKKKANTKRSINRLDIIDKISTKYISHGLPKTVLYLKTRIGKTCDIMITLSTLYLKG